MANLFANVAEATITPPAGIEMVEPVGVPSTGVHDDLYVRAIALSDGETTLVLVAMDLIGLDLELVGRVREAVEARAGLSAERLMLTATHTHSSPLTIPWNRSGQERRDRAWEGRMVEGIATTVAAAMRELAPVTLSAGRAEVQIGFNRRVSTAAGTNMQPNAAGSSAPWVDVLRLDRADGRPLAVLFSHAAHAVAAHVGSTEITADYPGYAVRAVRQHLGGDVVAMFAQGCCGDINVDPVGGGHPAAARAGAVLGEAAIAAVENARPLATGTLRWATRRFYLPFEPLDMEVIAAIQARAEEGRVALQAAAASRSDANKAALWENRELALWAERMQTLAQEGNALPGLPFEVQGFALGPDMALLGLTHEVFSAYQLYLQQHSPFAQTMVFGYTNGCADYIPTAEAFLLGGYEVQGAPKKYGWPPLQPVCERLVKQNGLEVLQELKKGYA